MKYIKEAMLHTRAKYMILVFLLGSGAAVAINTLQLQLISEAVSTYDMKYINMIIISGLAMAILSMCTVFGNMAKKVMYHHLINAYNFKIIDLDVKAFSVYSPGEILTVSGKVSTISNLVNTWIVIVREVINSLINLYAIYLLAPKMIFYVVLLYGISMFLLNIANKKILAIEEKRYKYQEMINIEADEIYNGFMEVRSFPDTSECHKKSTYRINSEMLRLKVDTQRWIRVLNIIIDSTNQIGTVILLLYLFLMNSKGMAMPSAKSLTLIMYCWRLGDPFINILFMYSDIGEMKIALPRFEKIMGYKNEIVDGEIELSGFSSKIEIDNISFSYNESDTVLDGVSMVIPKGQHIGICGPSGGGKSTFLKLIPRFYDVKSGSIKIDGIDIRELTLHSIRKHMGIVHQSTYIFGGTIKENIIYGRRPYTPTEHELIEACKKAAIYEFIMSLPDKFETKVGPRGITLSGGQKQRIALARIFLCNPDIVILDEATSSLDNESERLIQKALDNLKGKTLITVAHRLSTIENCDIIYVVDNHKIVESGTHEELMNLHGLYYNLHNTEKAS